MITPMNRRDFSKLLLSASALGLVDPRQLVWASSHSAGPEGERRLTKVDGRIPKDLFGTLVRTCPGQRENHGVRLRHIFDGDAFVTAYTFENGEARVRARYVDTPQRVEELKAGRMLYDEFGTPAPPPPDGWKAGRGKNQPTVNIIRWDGRLLGLSEGGAPTAIDAHTLAYQGEWDFHGTLPSDLTFTAHPRVDEAAGEGYAYGIRKGMGTALVVFRMERDGRLTKLYDLPQPGFFIVHDMLLTREHLLFLIPPARFDFQLFFSGQAKVAADAVRFYENEPMRVLVLRRDGKGEPMTIEQPTAMAFHHGNAFERDGRIVLDTVISPNGSALRAVYTLAKGETPEPSRQRLTRIEIDLAKRAVARRDVLDDRDVEFPRFDQRLVGQDARYLYTLAFEDATNTVGASAILRHDLRKGTATRVAAGKGRFYGEAVFAPRPGAASEDRGWLLAQGYDAARNENFVEILDAGTLELEARVWTGLYAPLGFHGNFVQ
jgi:all-trans-8'-apo-beta-carotenal 15,15'-oxygenase